MTRVNIVPICLLFITATLFLLPISCGSSGQSNTDSTSTQIPPTSTPTPTATQIPPTITPTPTATQISPTNTPTPTATQVPPTPTPTPTPTNTVIDQYGFTLAIDGMVSYETDGFTQSNANISDGVLFFEFSGANVILFWFQDINSELNSIIIDTYTSLAESQPDATFTTVSDGDLSVDSKTGKYLTFVTTTETGSDQLGGIIGSWRCGAETVFAATVTGNDSTVVQIRFKRLLDNFGCE